MVSTKVTGTTLNSSGIGLFIDIPTQHETNADYALENDPIKMALC